MTRQHVLLDADGVLQDPAGSWVDQVEPWLGDRAEEFMRESWARERPALSGQAEFLDVLTALLARYGVDLPAVELHRAVWCAIEVAPGSRELVEAVRAAGHGVHLGTNQERHRAHHMRHHLGYDDLFDVSCYSYELGVAKPDPAYFVAAVERIGAEPGDVVFVDDRADNVEAARGVGLRAAQWSLAEGPGTLAGLLARQGIDGLPAVPRVPAAPSGRPTLDK